MSDDQSGETDDGSRLPDGLFRGGTEGEGMWHRPVSKFGDELTDDTLFRRSRRRAAPDDGHPEAVVNPQTGGYSPKRVDAFGPSLSSDLPASDFPASDFPGSWDQAFAAGAARPAQPTDEPRGGPPGGGAQRPFTAAGESGEPPQGGPQVGEFDRHHPFTRSLVKTLASAIIPGLGLIRSRARWLGVTLTGAVLLAVIVIGGWALSDPVAAAATAVKPSVLHPLSIVLVVVALLWVVVIVGTHLITRPAHRTRAQSIVGALVVGGLSFAIAAPMAVASRYSATQAGLVEGVFSSSDQKKSQTRPTIDTKGKAADVWAKKPRLNILLVGLDNTAARHYSDVDVSTDTMMVASIETSTGNMVITQVPRNMARVPFPTGSELSKRYPRGWYDGKNADNSNYFANAIWGHLPAEQPDLFKNTDYPGADALKYGLEGALGLKIDYFVALNIDGLMALIDAMGGVRLNVNQRIPIGGNDVRGPVGYIEPGQNKLLNGYYAMWYARARHGLDGGDFSRMGRQTCVIKGVLDQADPATMLTRYEAIAKASEKMVETDIPQDLLPALLELAVRVKNGRQARVLFVHQKDGFITYDPDYAMMRARVAAAIKAVDEQPSGTPSAVPSSATPSGSESSATPSAPAGSTSATPAPAESLVDACAWDPASTASPSATPRR